MKYAGSGTPIPITDPDDQQRLARIESLSTIRGPADKSHCAICGSKETTKNVYGLKVHDNQTGAETRNAFHLCEVCVPILTGDLEALMRLGRKGTQ